MIVSVMQPYLFPYLGYYQLAFHADKFVFYDDVNYIKNGFINRNNFLVNQELKRITFPVNNVSVNKEIKEHYFIESFDKQIRTIQQSYSKSPFYNDVFPVVESVLKQSKRNVSSLTSNSVIEVMKYLDLDFEYAFSSDLDFDRQKSAQEKVIDITKLIGGKAYTNSIGGMDLYDRAGFQVHGIDLNFIQIDSDIYYEQGTKEFIPNLSMVDVLMWNSKEYIIELLCRYEIR